MKAPMKEAAIIAVSALLITATETLLILNCCIHR